MRIKTQAQLEEFFKRNPKPWAAKDEAYLADKNGVIIPADDLEAYIKMLEGEVEAGENALKAIKTMVTIIVE